jgi:LacI family transcriptional regulator
MDKVPTIKDVAELAGVHSSTASRALRPDTRDTVSDRTVKRVLDAARKLGFAPNSAARSLRTKTSSVVGVIIPDLRNPVFPSIVRGIEDGLREAGYMAMLANTDGDPETERKLIAAMRARQIDGFILATSRRDDLPPTHDGELVPTVLVNRDTDDGSVSAVTADNAAGIGAAVQLLVGLGHRRIAHVAAPRELSTGWERYRAFVDAMARHGLTVSEAQVRFCEAFTEDAGRRAAGSLLDDNPAITAIVAVDDLVAIGCYSALAERGLSCPDDVSVTGFNDTPFVGTPHPALTTIHIPHYDMGIESARLLLARIKDPGAAPKRIVLPVRLVARDSAAAPPMDAAPPMERRTR